MKKVRIMISVVIINLIVTGWVGIVLPIGGTCESITEFGNPDSGDERIITFAGETPPLIDASTFIEFPLHKGSVRSAHLKLTAMDLNDEYPLKPQLDVGLDGDVDWQFNGTGYGPLGCQNVFNTDESDANVYTETMPNQNYGIKLPMGATVTSSQLGLEGGAEKPQTGRNPTSGTTQSTLQAEYEHHDKLITYIEVYCVNNGGGTVTVNGWDYKNSTWEQIYYYYGWSYPRNIIYDPIEPKYTKWDITHSPHYSWYNIYYSFTYNVKMGAYNASLDIGNDGGVKEWSRDLEFNTTATLDMTAKLNQLMTGTPIPSGEDSYGVQYVEIPFIFVTEGPGAIRIYDLEVKYEFEMQIEVKPDLENITTELNDLLPTEGEGNFKVYLEFSSRTPGKLKIWDLYLAYNGAPTTTHIEDYELDEDTADKYLVDLTGYFDDDYDDPQSLIYLVEEYTNPKYVKVKTYQHYLWVNATKTPNSNWHGETEVVVSASDEESIKTYSNRFKVKVNPVDDPPTVGTALPNVTVIENRTNKNIDLGSATERYFEDIDSDELYFKAELTEPQYHPFLTVGVDEDDKLVLTSIGKWAKSIPVRIYCDDEPITESVNPSLIEVYQDIVVEIISATGLYPPEWSDIPDVYIPEDTILEDWLTLTDYASDYDDINANLSFSIVTYSNSGYIDISIDSNNRIDIFPHADFDNTSKVTLKVEDIEGNFATTTFRIHMIPCNDEPTVAITSPEHDATVTGITTINGTAFDIEDELEYIELKLGKSSDEWVKADRQSFWSYRWDTNEQVPDKRDKIQVYARSFDGKNYSIEYTIEVIVDNKKLDGDGDGHPDADDEFPNDPSEWKDADGDGVGDNSDVFPTDRKEWLDTDGDGYGDNSDAFTLDPSQWEDEDGDGYGDNPDGNNADLDPSDPKVNIEKEEESEEVDYSEFAPILWYVVLIFIVINALILTMFAVGQYKKKARQ